MKFFVLKDYKEDIGKKAIEIIKYSIIFITNNGIRLPLCTLHSIQYGLLK